MSRTPGHANSRWPYPRLIAHRGGGSLAPENTLAAMRTGHAQGFKTVEFDVVLAADGVPMLMHDDTVDRTTNGHGRIAELDSVALAKLDAGAWHSATFAGEPVPTFEAAAKLCVELGLWANVEIKPTPRCEAETGVRAAELARHAWHAAMQRGIAPPLLSSFQPESLRAALATAPELPRGLLCDLVPQDWRERMRELQCMTLHCNALRLGAGTAREITAAGYGLAVWTVNDAAEAERLFAIGVDAIFTDRLDLFGRRAEGQAT